MYRNLLELSAFDEELHQNNNVDGHFLSTKQNNVQKGYN